MEKKKLRIVFLTYYSGDVYRGVETLVHELANKLVEFGHGVEVRQHGPAITGSTYKTVTVQSRSLKDFNNKALENLQADVILPMNGGWQVYASRFWANKNKAKMIVSGQAGPGRDDRYNLFSFPDSFIGMTDYQCKWAKKANPLVRVVKIPNGVDINKFKPTPKKKKGKDVLAVAALVPIKRLDLAIKAVAKINDANLTIVGSGEQKEYLSILGGEQMPGRLKITSAPYEEIPEVYKEADLFTFPTSPWESFGIAMLEAMASGLPVVASDDLIRREIVGDAGSFVNPENTEEYAAAIQKALDTDWGDKPRRQSEKFSWEIVAKQYEELFLELTNG